MADSNAMQTVQNSTGDSPRELIAAYLNSKGMPLTNANYALALKANSDVPGSIPGLVSMEPVRSPGDPPPGSRAPTRSSGASNGNGSGGGSSGSPSARRSDPPPRSFEGANRTERPERGGDQRAADRRDAGAGGGGSTSRYTDADSLAAAILLGMPGAAAAGYGGKKIADMVNKPVTLGIDGPAVVRATNATTSAVDAPGRPMLPDLPTVPQAPSAYPPAPPDGPPPVTRAPAAATMPGGDPVADAITKALTPAATAAPPAAAAPPVIEPPPVTGVAPINEPPTSFLDNLKAQMNAKRLATGGLRMRPPRP